MASYNKINGKKATQSQHLLTDVLRTDFGFKGFVLSDWWAMPPSFNADTDPGLLKSYAVEAVQAGHGRRSPLGAQLRPAREHHPRPRRADRGRRSSPVGHSASWNRSSASRPTGSTGTVGLGTPITKYSKSRISCNGPHLALAEKAAVESMVLLKNDNATLPINPRSRSWPSSARPFPTTRTTARWTRGRAASSTSPPTSGRGPRIEPRLSPSDQGRRPVRGHVPRGRRHAERNHLRQAHRGDVTTATNNGADLAPVMAATADADFVVVVAGLTAEDEGEEYTPPGDRHSLRARREAGRRRTRTSRTR